MWRILSLSHRRWESSEKRETGSSISWRDKCSCDDVTRGSVSTDAEGGGCAGGTLKESPVLFRHDENCGCD